ncbi:uncharacterized protein MELLADRAFT_101002 [Melampsora larici-populina 98AG31]|uniref:Chalcone isomerase domain-containing protein n=1 Tax=Melampsora larici-populina (strain 98AG31 / pathotype 3-4-7) TaxID=747676 RepID=F4R3A3_MELLP|nr:uncharacterized protein MELLADRAFT_101002 [Melampsora larici-populina 98AG31]EGG12593.1 hypothetical protein MELLADRAFT_101002 [Melampsora larici-populina 98AG31]
MKESNSTVLLFNLNKSHPHLRRLYSENPQENPPLTSQSSENDTPILDPNAPVSFLYENNGQEPLRLIGLGVFTASFLGVCSAGCYFNPHVLRALRFVLLPGWNFRSISLPTTSATDEELPPVIEKPILREALMWNFITVSVQFDIQIAPAGSADFTYLRDVFCRSLTAHVTHATTDSLLLDFEAEHTLPMWILALENCCIAPFFRPHNYQVSLRRVTCVKLMESGNWLDNKLQA